VEQSVVAAAAMEVCVKGVMKVKVRSFTAQKGRNVQYMNVVSVYINIKIAQNVKRYRAIYGRTQETLSIPMKNLRKI
jgi:hypothetical protein